MGAARRGSHPRGVVPAAAVIPMVTVKA